MLKKLTVPFALSALVLIGVTACNRDPIATTPQPDASQTASNTQSQDNTEAKAYQNNERSRRREAIRKQIESALTQDQAKQFEAKLQQGEKMRQALSELNLTPEQKTKIQAAVRSARTQSQKPAESSQQ